MADLTQYFTHMCEVLSIAHTSRNEKHRACIHFLKSTSPTCCFFFPTSYSDNVRVAARATQPVLRASHDVTVRENMALSKSVLGSRADVCLSRITHVLLLGLSGFFLGIMFTMLPLFYG